MSKNNEKKDEIQIARFQGMFISALMNFEAEELKDIILGNEMPKIIEMLSYSEQYNIPYVDGIKNAIYNRRNEIIPLLTVDSITKYGVDYGRPDLVKVLNTKKGMIWLERFLKYIKFIINNLNLSSVQIENKLINTIKKKREEQKVEDVPEPEEVKKDKEIEDEVDLSDLD